MSLLGYAIVSNDVKFHLSVLLLDVFNAGSLLQLVDLRIISKNHIYSTIL